MSARLLGSAAAIRAGSAYVNFMMEEAQDRIRASYGESHGQLAAVKVKYDPENFFRVNQNILPAITDNES